MLGGTFLTYVKETVTILRPMKSSFLRGATATNRQSPTFSLRMPADTLHDITMAAALLDMDKTAFVRWAAHATAIEIIKQKNEFDKLK